MIWRWQEVTNFWIYLGKLERNTAISCLKELLMELKMTWGTPEVRSVKINLIDFWHLKFDLIDFWHLTFDLIDFWHSTFDLIDFWHLTFNQWTNGPMDQWTKGPMDQWTNGPMDPWTNGPMDQWTNGPVGQWTSGQVDLCPFDNRFWHIGHLNLTCT